MSSRRLAQQRKAMWRRNPRCHYCGAVTILRPLHLPREPLPLEIRDKVATIDHVRARHHPDRRKPPEPGEILHVLSCWRCNNERNRRELSAKPKEYFYQNGQPTPLDHRSLEELESVLTLLRDRKPRRKDKQRKWERSVEALEAAIASRR